MASDLNATEKPDQIPVLWITRPMATAARQFVKSLFRPSTIIYPYERLEDPKFRTGSASAPGCRSASGRSGTTTAASTR